MVDCCNKSNIINTNTTKGKSTAQQPTQVSSAKANTPKGISFIYVIQHTNRIKRINNNQNNINNTNYKIKLLSNNKHIYVGKTSVVNEDSLLQQLDQSKKGRQSDIMSYYINNNYHINKYHTTIIIIINFDLKNKSIYSHYLQGKEEDTTSKRKLVEIAPSTKITQLKPKPVNGGEDNSVLIPGGTNSDSGPVTPAKKRNKVLEETEEDEVQEMK